MAPNISYFPVLSYTQQQGSKNINKNKPQWIEYMLNSSFVLLFFLFLFFAFSDIIKIFTLLCDYGKVFHMFYFLNQWEVM